jgi:hypothetical protein
MKAMIRKIKRQTHETIFSFLSRLGQRADVYSTQPEDLCPTLVDKCVYAYAKDSELVLVMIDAVLEGTQEYADFGFSNPTKPTYFRNVTTFYQQRMGDKRVSPVWSLFQAAMSVDQLLNKDLEFPIKVHALLITNGHITNLKELRSAIGSMDIKFGMNIIHDGQTFLNQWSVLKLPVNEDNLLPEYAYLQAYKRELDRQGGRFTEEDQDEFGRLLAEFVSQEFDSSNKDDKTENVEEKDECPSDDDLGLDDAALDVSTRLAACRTLKERKQFLIRFAKQRFSKRVGG